MKKYYFLLCFLSSLACSYKAYEPSVEPPIPLAPHREAVDVYYAQDQLSESLIPVGMLWQKDVFQGDRMMERELIIQARKAGWDAVLVQDYVNYYEDIEEEHLTPPDFIGLALILAGVDSVELRPREPYTTVKTVHQYEARIVGLVDVGKAVKRAKLIDYIAVEQRREGKRLDSCLIYFNWRRQIDSIAGNQLLYEEVRLIQPWFFLDQKDTAWTYRQRRNYPLPNRIFSGPPEQFHYILSEGLSYGLHYVLKNDENIKQGNIYIEYNNGRPYTRFYRNNQGLDTVESLFIGEKLMEQFWYRSGKNDLIHFKYHYKNARSNELDELVFRYGKPISVAQ